MKKSLLYILCFVAVVMCRPAWCAGWSQWAEWNFSADFDASGEITAQQASDSGSLLRRSASTSAFSILAGKLACSRTGPVDYLYADINDITANGGGSYVNEYTLIYDIKRTGPEQLPLHNTGSDNYNAADLWIRSDGSVGDGGYTPAGIVPVDTWARLAVTYRVSGTKCYRNIYVDGVLKQADYSVGDLDSKYSLYTDAQKPGGQFTILGDYDSTVYGGCRLANFGFVAATLSGSEIAALGPYDGGQIGLGSTGGGDPPDGDLMAHWRFASDYVSGRAVTDASGNGHDGIISGVVNIVPDPPVLMLDGSSTYVSVDDAPLPSRGITVEAWCMVEQPVNWAGIVNYIQDNGSVEHGWILGQYSGSFMFGLSTGGLTYLNADEPFDTGTWYHVAGTYDGAQMNIFVNGEVAGSSTAQSGDISYLPSWFRLGSYKDDNEQYLWNGMLGDVKVYDNVLTGDEIRQNYESQKGDYGVIEMAEVKAGPYVHFAGKGKVTVHYLTDQAVPSAVQYGFNGQLSETASDATPKTVHKLVLTGLRPESDYSYRILMNQTLTDMYSFYSEFDYGPEPLADTQSPYPVDELTPLYEQAAEYILGSAGIQKGVCIDYGCGIGRLSYEIAKRSELKIIALEPDAQLAAQARDYLDRAGAYGTRVTVLNRSLADVKCRDFSANLIVSDRMIGEGYCPGDVSEVRRILRPVGGAAILGQPPGCPNVLARGNLTNWLVGTAHTLTDAGSADGLWARIDRDDPAGAGKWTHLYADTANTANSGEASLTNTLKLLWYGRPGPRYIIDRHNRPMPSLCNKGVIVTPGANRILAYDAYNGTRYWDVAIPEVTRVPILRDCGWMALADDYVYVAHKQNCLGLDLKTGEPKLFMEAPQLINGQERHWGFLAVHGQNLIGSGQKKGASLNWKGATRVDEAYWDNRNLATSDYLFCTDRHSGELRWTYKRASGSSIINPCIAVGGDYLYFIESRNAAAVNDSDGRVQAATLMSGSSEYLIKLNINTGDVVDSAPVDLPFQHIAYLTWWADGDLVIATGSQNAPGARYEHRAFRGGDLGAAWEASYNLGGTGGSHGEQDQHPCIVADTMYMRQYKVNLTNGAVTGFGISRGNCGTQSASKTHLFGRNGNPYMYTLPGGAATRLTNESRPGCWINMIPAGGLLLIPESSSGCTCDFSIQTSMAFMPVP